jgi:rare lipoprotein A
MGFKISGSAKTCGRVAVLLTAALTLANCKTTSSFDPKYGVTASPRKYKDGDVIPKGNGRYHVGKPYVIAGVTYVPQENPNYRAVGTASWYGDAFHGRLTSNGEIFDMRSLTAAHPTLPLPSYVRVTNMTNGKSVVVRVNDRGPFHSNRVIDVSSRAAELLGFRHHGTARVRVEYVGKANLNGSDDRRLEATLSHNGTPAPSPNPVRVAQQRPFIEQPETPQVMQRRPAPVATAEAKTRPATVPTSFSPASLTARGLY